MAQWWNNSESIRRKTCLSATLPAASPMWTQL